MTTKSLDYELAVDVVDDGKIVRGTILNLSDETWRTAQGDGELKIGLRLLVDGRVIGFANLPEIGPNDTQAFQITVSEHLGPGVHELSIEPFRHNQFWFSDRGQQPHRLSIVRGPTFARDRQDFGSDLVHPYRGLPDWAFWKRSVVERTPETLEPVVSVPFTISKTDRVATAGSCFAQRLSDFLSANGFNFFRTEEPLEENGPLFSANYGNIYSTLQLHQLLLRAFGLLLPVDISWKRADARYIDPFRPQLYTPGYSTEAEVVQARNEHLQNVRRVFLDSDVFIFTLGLTETWINTEDGVALPVTPGAVAQQAGHGPYEMINLSTEQVTNQLAGFIDDLRLINPAVRVVLTVSPVPLVATFEKRHVLSSTTLSKSVLRVAADAIERTYENVSYFPSYEIVTGPLMGNTYFEPDLRSIKPEGVRQVMSVFSQSYLSGNMPLSAPPVPSAPVPTRKASAPKGSPALRLSTSMMDVLCDEDLLEV